jgi:hypothetical protein
LENGPAEPAAGGEVAPPPEGGSTSASTGEAAQQFVDNIKDAMEQITDATREMNARISESVGKPEGRSAIPEYAAYQPSNTEADAQRGEGQRTPGGQLYIYPSAPFSALNRVEKIPETVPQGTAGASAISRPAPIPATRQRSLSGHLEKPGEDFSIPSPTPADPRLIVPTDKTVAKQRRTPTFRKERLQSQFNRTAQRKRKKPAMETPAEMETPIPMRPRPGGSIR